MSMPGNEHTPRRKGGPKVDQAPLYCRIRELIIQRRLNLSQGNWIHVEPIELAKFFDCHYETVLGVIGKLRKKCPEIIFRTKRLHRVDSQGKAIRGRPQIICCSKEFYAEHGEPHFETLDGKPTHIREFLRGKKISDVSSGSMENPDLPEKDRIRLRQNSLESMHGISSVSSMTSDSTVQRAPSGISGHTGQPGSTPGRQISGRGKAIIAKRCFFVVRELEFLNREGRIPGRFSAGHVYTFVFAGLRAGYDAQAIKNSWEKASKVVSQESNPQNFPGYVRATAAEFLVETKAFYDRSDRTSDQELRKILPKTKFLPRTQTEQGGEVSESKKTPAKPISTEGIAPKNPGMASRRTPPTSFSPSPMLGLFRQFQKESMPK